MAISRCKSSRSPELCIPNLDRLFARWQVLGPGAGAAFSRGTWDPLASASQRRCATRVPHPAVPPSTCNPADDRARPLTSAHEPIDFDAATDERLPQSGSCKDTGFLGYQPANLPFAVPWVPQRCAAYSFQSQQLSLCSTRPIHDSRITPVRIIAATYIARHST